MRNVLYLLIVSILCFACSKDDLEANQVLIRVENVSNYDFDSLLLNSVDYGTLDAGARSSYKAHDVAYNYSTIMLNANDKHHHLQVIDVVGETPLENGYYRYEVGISEDTDEIFFNFIEE